MPSNSENLWAEHGLTGLVLFALFALIGVFIKVITLKDEKHQETLLKVISDERGEREATRHENSRNAEKLSEAIGGLAKELSKK